MKYRLLLPFLIFLISNSSAQEKLRGRVKSVHYDLEYTVVEKFGEYQKGGVTAFAGGNDIIMHDIYGNVMEHKYSHDYGGTRETFLFDIIDHKRMVEKNTYSILYYSGGGEKYKLEEKTKFKYDNKGNNIEINYYNGDGSLYSKLKNKYDSTGNNVEQIRYKADGGLENKEIKKYDDNNNCIAISIYDSNGKIVSEHTYSYVIDDKSLKISEKIAYKKNIKTDRIVYNDKGAIIETNSYDEKGNITSKEIKEYDKYDNCILINHSGAYANYKESFEYVYDNNFNWIKCTDFRDDIPNTIQERKITYY